MERAKKYLENKTTPTGAKSSVRYGNSTRFDEAMKQAKMDIVDIRKIIDYTNEFLELLGMNCIAKPKIEQESWKNGFNNIYEKTKDAYDLEDVRDIVWMKFTKDGYLGVVAVSNDINFDIPKCGADGRLRPCVHDDHPGLFYQCAGAQNPPHLPFGGGVLHWRRGGKRHHRAGQYLAACAHPWRRVRRGVWLCGAARQKIGRLAFGAVLPLPACSPGSGGAASLCSLLFPPEPQAAFSCNPRVYTV